MLEQHLLQRGVQNGFILHPRRGEFGIGQARRQRIASNPKLRAFLGEDFGHVDHRRLGHRVDALADPRRNAIERGDVDDAAAAAFAHQVAGFDRHEEVIAEFHVDGFLESNLNFFIAI